MNILYKERDTDKSLDYIIYCVINVHSFYSTNKDQLNDNCNYIYKVETYYNFTGENNDFSSFQLKICNMYLIEINCLALFIKQSFSHDL